MKIEHHHNGTRYTLSNDNILNGDKVYPIARGRTIDNDWILSDLDFREFMCGFPDNPHIIMDMTNSDYKPYEVRTSCGYGPKEMYFKVIKKEVKVNTPPPKGQLFGWKYDWVDITVC